MNGGPSITRAVAVANGDIFKNGQVPAPYSSEFTLDNNDGLVVLEANDYNGVGENYQIQGIQIMQSANGLTGQGINLNGLTGTNLGGSDINVTQSFADGSPLGSGAISDIGFIQNTSGTLDANLDFALNIQDGDGDTTGIQHLLVDVVHA